MRAETISLDTSMPSRRRIMPNRPVLRLKKPLLRYQGVPLRLDKGQKIIPPVTVENPENIRYPGYAPQYGRR